MFLDELILNAFSKLQILHYTINTKIKFWNAD